MHLDTATGQCAASKFPLHRTILLFLQLGKKSCIPVVCLYIHTACLYSKVSLSKITSSKQVERSARQDTADRAVISWESNHEEVSNEGGRLPCHRGGDRQLWLVGQMNESKWIFKEIWKEGAQDKCCIFFSVWLKYNENKFRLSQELIPAGAGFLGHGGSCQALEVHGGEWRYRITCLRQDWWLSGRWVAGPRMSEESVLLDAVNLRSWMMATLCLLEFESDKLKNFGSACTKHKWAPFYPVANKFCV